MAKAKFLIVSREFGYPIYSSPVAGDISDNRAEAHEFAEGEDNGKRKANYMTAIFGYKFEVEPCAS